MTSYWHDIPVTNLDWHYHYPCCRVIIPVTLKQWFFADNYRPSQQTTLMSEVKFSKQTHIKKSIWRTKILWKCSFSAKTGKFLKLDLSPCPWWNSPNNFCSKLFFVRINNLSNVLVKLSCLGKPKSKICFKLQCRQK